MDAADLQTQPPPALRLVELLSIGDQADETGRLLLEDSASPQGRRQAERQGIAMRSDRCPYKDTPSRFGGRMNVSAYEALRAETAGVLDGFAWLSSQSLAANRSRAATVPLLYDVSYLGLTLPLVLVHRAADPFSPTGELPAVVASIFKASRGLFSVAVDLRNQGGPLSRPIAPATVVTFADQHHHLVRRQPPRVCAAPTRLIERTIAVILGGDGGDGAASRLPDWVSFQQLWACFAVQDDLSEALSTYRYVLDQLRAATAASNVESLFARMVPGTSGTFGQLTEAMLAHTHSAQVQLNRLLGRKDDPVPLTSEELLALL